MKNIMNQTITLFGDSKKNVFIFFFLFIVLLLMVPLSHHYDLDLFLKWGLHNYQYGISKIYIDSNTDYMPITHYLLYFFVSIQSDLSRLDITLPLFKLIFTAIEFVFALLLLRFLKIKADWIFYFLIIVLNPAFFYNSYVWGQVDSLYSFVVIISLYLGYKNKIPAAFGIMAFALLCKFQAIFYIPILGLIALPHFINRPITIFWSALSIIVVLFIFTAPLENPFAIIDIMKNSVDRYPFPTVNAFNIWFLFESKPALMDLGAIKDTDPFLGLNYKIYGYILFFTASFFALLPLLKKTWRNILTKNYSFSYELIALSGALVALNFFYFLTQMHERYCHTCIFFIIIYCFSKKKYLIYTLFSYAYLANLVHIYNFFKFENVGTFVFHPILISILFGTVLILLFKEIYKNHYKIG